MWIIGRLLLYNDNAVTGQKIKKIALSGAILALLLGALGFMLMTARKTGNGNADNSLKNNPFGLAAAVKTPAETPESEEQSIFADSLAIQKDTDADGIPDWKETLLGFDAANEDTDGDGIADGDELESVFTDRGAYAPVVSEKISAQGGAVSPDTETQKEVFAGSGAAVPAPRISTILPTKARDGTEIVIKGEGFSKNGNVVDVGYAAIRDIPSLDGKTMRVTLPRMKSDETRGILVFDPTSTSTAPITSLFEKYGINVSFSENPAYSPEASVAPLSFPIFVYVENEYGESNRRQMVFTLYF